MTRIYTDARYVLTADAQECLPEIGRTILRAIDFRGGSVRVAPVADPRDRACGYDVRRAVWVFADELETVEVAQRRTMDRILTAS